LEKNISQNNNTSGPAQDDTENISDFQHLIEEPDNSSFLSIRKDLILVLIVVIVVFIAYLSPLKEYVQRIPELSRRIAEMGVCGPSIFVLTVCLLVIVGVPRLLLCPVGGMAFGFFPGLMYAVIGTMLAYYVVFLFVRWGGRKFVIRHFPRLNKFTKVLEHGGIPAVILARQMPIHGMVINLILGLSPVRHRDFLIGTAIGLFPEAIPCTLVGSGVGQGSLGKSTIYMVLALLALVVLWFGVNIHSKRKKRHQ
jgi:uncharacterized membrane protein YdjX (TVP38/TMEM64 family)